MLKKVKKIKLLIIIKTRYITKINYIKSFLI